MGYLCVCVWIGVLPSPGSSTHSELEIAYWDILPRHYLFRRLIQLHSLEVNFGEVTTPKRHYSISFNYDRRY